LKSSYSNADGQPLVVAFDMGYILLKDSLTKAFGNLFGFVDSSSRTISSPPYRAARSKGRLSWNTSRSDISLRI
jgi:hypothetical protein